MKLTLTILLSLASLSAFSKEIECKSRYGGKTVYRNGNLGEHAFADDPDSVKTVKVVSGKKSYTLRYESDIANYMAIISLEKEPVAFIQIMEDAEYEDKAQAFMNGGLYHGQFSLTLKLEDRTKFTYMLSLPRVENTIAVSTVEVSCKVL
jgi:hypothetical protein